MRISWFQLKNTCNLLIFYGKYHFKVVFLSFFKKNRKNGSFWPLKPYLDKLEQKRHRLVHIRCTCRWILMNPCKLCFVTVVDCLWNQAWGTKRCALTCFDITGITVFIVKQIMMLNSNQWHMTYISKCINIWLLLKITITKRYIYVL